MAYVHAALLGRTSGATCSAHLCADFGVCLVLRVHAHLGSSLGRVGLQADHARSTDCTKAIQASESG